MSSKLARIQGFVDSLEMSHLSEKQQMTLTVNPEEVMGGTSINDKCTNASGCGASINSRKCVNAAGECAISLNEKKCSQPAV